MVPSLRVKRSNPFRRAKEEWIASSWSLSSGARSRDPLARNDGLMLSSSKRLAEKFRTFQPVSPGQLDRLGEADPQPGDDVRLARAGMQRDRGSIQRQARLP